MSGKDKDKSRKPKPKPKAVTALFTEESEDGSSEDNSQPANPQAQVGAVPATTDTSKDAGGAPKSKSPISRVGSRISKFLRRTPPKAHPDSSPQKKAATEKHWVPEALGAPSTSAAGEEEEETPMELLETPTGPIPEPDWMNPRLTTCPPELYGPMFDPFRAGMHGPVERIPLDPNKGLPPPSITDPAPLARTEDLCSPAGVDFEEEESVAGPSGSQVTTAVVHGSDEPPRRSPPPPPIVPPPQPEVPPPEPEERAQRELRPRRKGEPRR